MRAPGGRCGAKPGREWTRKPQVGDLVLAKVKGYPPWPAKVTKPEDWGQTPTPGRFFVSFYGTKEIAFVTLADLQEFTEKAKNKLLDRAPSIKLPTKYAPSFHKAVEQICKAYGELPKSSESASGALPDLSGKPSEHLVKLPDDSENLGPGQMEVDNPINKWTRRPQLGDLVLAKVKGYPPWPAKVTKPEDWGQTPTLGRFFVCFYGTKEIAFVALADLQEFTEKVKNKLLDQAPSIKVPTKYAPLFNKAVEQICKAYGELPKASENASNALPDLSGKLSEHVVKSPDDSGTLRMGQMEVDNPINKSTRGPHLGDLVLAKVKGYPPWPAKVTKPEDLGHTPTPGRFFVSFYGTKATGFVTLADLQEFTEKAKNELLGNKAQKRHASSFNEAVEQICKAYDELQSQRKLQAGLCLI